MARPFNRTNKAGADSRSDGLWRFLLIVIFATVCLNAQAAPGDVFTWRDEHGRTHYGDHPAEGAQRLRIRPPSAAAANARVARVYDGDTIQLENGDKVRLLGVNTPEVGHRGKAAEAGGDEARKWLTERLAGHTVRLEADTTPMDKYHRRLAHVFLADGTHINLALVREGLATTDFFPPDLKYVDQLVSAERQAERERRGLWALDAYRPRPAGAPAEVAGWQRLVGTVVAVNSGKRYARLRMREPLEIHIANTDLPRFPPLESYTGQALEVRGWARRKGAGYAVNVRHPSALVKPEAEPGTGRRLSPSRETR